MGRYKSHDDRSQAEHVILVEINTWKMSCMQYFSSERGEMEGNSYFMKHLQTVLILKDQQDSFFFDFCSVNRVGLRGCEYRFVLCGLGLHPFCMSSQKFLF